METISHLVSDGHEATLKKKKSLGDFKVDLYMDKPWTEPSNVSGLSCQHC